MSDGTMTPVLRAAEMVISLLTEPGSYTWVNAVADGASTGAAVAAGPGDFGAPVTLTGTAGGCGVAGGRHGELGVGEDLAGLRVHQQGDPVRGLGRHDGLGQGLLGVVLQGLVDAEDQVLAGDGRPVHLPPAGDLMPVRVDLGH